ncbi:hypothetical protein [Nocardia sp. NPDC004123]
MENCDDRVVVYVCELDPAIKTYEPTGIYHDRLEVSVPFTITLDLAQALQRKGSREK